MQRFTLDELKDILVACADVPATAAIDDPATTLVDLGVDSVGLLAIRLHLEARYGVTVREDEALQLSTLGAAIEYVNALIARRG